MKTKLNTHAAAGGTLRQQLAEKIRSLPVPETPQRRIPRRVRVAIEAVRRYLCAEAGVPATIVKDADVATLALKLDWAFLYSNHFAIGFVTLEELKVWAADTLAGRETGR